MKNDLGLEGFGSEVKNMAPVIAHSDDIRGHFGTDYFMCALIQNMTGLCCGD
jgi:hypothetical protein